MRKLLFTFKGLPVFLSLVLFFAFTGETRSQVSFSIAASVSGNVNTGEFTSSGLNMSTGNFLEQYSFNGKKTHSEVTFIYSNGTITAKTHSDIVLTSATTATGTGRWIVVRGTGAYTGIQGSGTLTLSVTGISTNENIEQEWSGMLK